MAVFYDTHAHLDFPDFDSDREAVVRRAREAGIERILSVGTDLDSSRAAIGFAESYEEVFAVVGWHPCHVLEAPADIRDELRALAGHPKVVALGETGLDQYRLPSQKEGTPEDDVRYLARQREVFVQHLEVAAEVGLNCVIHQRAAFEETLELLAPYQGRVRGVFHCFVDDADRMRQVMALGSLVSFTGIATFKNAAEVRETLVAAPADGFMLETDCPYLAPVPHRGKRCEPSYVADLARSVAEARGVGLEELGGETCATARAFFKGLK